MGVVEDILKAYEEIEKAYPSEKIPHKMDYGMYAGFEPYKPSEKEEREDFIKKMLCTTPTIAPSSCCICSLISDLDDFTGAVKEAGRSVDDLVDAFRYAFKAFNLDGHVRGWHYRQMIHRNKQKHESSR